MLKVGITGGIGSGKSTVAKVFNTLGIPVYYADAQAKTLMQTNPQIKAALLQHFGAATFANNQLNRQYLSTQVFNNPEKLALLNSIVHPITIAHAAQWMAQQTTLYAIKEAALFFETGSHQHVDVMIGVYAPTALRIQRVMQRDACTRDEVQARIAKQLNENIKMRLCDYVITNDNQNAIVPQVIALHQLLLSKAAT
jgi:dephospho-CoA kinase